MAAVPCHYITTIESIEITIAPVEQPPFNADAIVEEQDTHLLLSVEPGIRYPAESYKSLVNHMIIQQPRSPGEIIVKKTHPLRFFAIIHDIKKKPTWKTEWIVEALEQLFHEIEKYKVTTLAMPLLGTIHGSLNDEDFIKLLIAALQVRQLHYPEKIWLVVPALACNRIGNFFERNLPHVTVKVN